MIKRIELENLKIYVKQFFEIPGYEQLKVDVNVQRSFLKGVGVAFSTYITSQKLPEKEIKYPKTWWDAFKVQYYPVWLLKLFPAKLEVVTISAQLMYPDLLIPDQRHFIYELKDKPLLTITEQAYEP